MIMEELKCSCGGTVSNTVSQVREAQKRRKIKSEDQENREPISIPSVLRELLGLKEGREMKLELTKEGVIAKVE